MDNQKFFNENKYVILAISFIEDKPIACMITYAKPTFEEILNDMKNFVPAMGGKCLFQTADDLGENPKAWAYIQRRNSLSIVTTACVSKDGSEIISGLGVFSLDLFVPTGNECWNYTGWSLPM